MLKPRFVLFFYLQFLEIIKRKGKIDIWYIDIRYIEPSWKGERNNKTTFISLLKCFQIHSVLLIFNFGIM